MFRPRPRQKVLVKVKGWVASPIIYEIRFPTGDSSAFLSPFEEQRWGRWDSDSCWVLGGMITPAEINLNWLWTNGMFSQEAKDFFTSNGYVDSNDKFSLSERFHEILCGNKDNGGTSPEAWQSAQKRGFIPRSMLTYSVAQGNQWNTQQDFDTDYFNVKYVTPAMILLGQESLKYINIAYQGIRTDIQSIQNAYKMSPPSFGIPIPINVFNWNEDKVQYDGAKIISHEVCGTGGQYNIVDQYVPFQKILSSDYLIGVCTQGIIYAIPQIIKNPIPQPSNVMWYTYLINLFNNALKSFTFG